MHDTDPFPEFSRKSAASLAGDYLPEDSELMAGMPFFEGAITSDIAAWGRTRAEALRELADSDIVRRHLRLLDGLAMNPGEGAVERLLAADDPELAWYESETRPSLLRARLYLAHYRVPRHMAYVAAELAMLSLSQTPSRSCHLMAKAFAWIALCRESQQRSASRSVTGFAVFEEAFRIKFGGALVPQRACEG